MVPFPSQAPRRDRGIRSPSVVATTLAAALVMAVAMTRGAAVRAVDQLAAVPDEPGVTLIAGPTYGALTIDLDEDGTRELVTIEQWAISPAQLAVGIWRQVADGTWATTGQAPLRRKTSPDEQRSAVPHPDAEGELALGVNDGTRLIAWRDGRRLEALVAVNAATGFNGAPACCLTIWRVSSGSPGGAPNLTLVADTGRGAIDVLAADLDGDGTDELVIREPPSPGAPSAVPVTVLRWDGTVLNGRPTTVTGLAAASTWLTILGDSDGRPGDEAALIGPAAFGTGTCGSVTDSQLTRIALYGGEVEQESLCMEGAAAPVAVRDALGPGRSAIYYGGNTTEVSAVEWPAASAPTEVILPGFTRPQGRPLAVLGSGSSAWLVLRHTVSGQPVIELDHPDLSLASARGVTPSPAAARLMGSPVTPYVGKWPETPAGPASFLFAGTLLEPVAGTFPAIRSIPAFAGAAPLGVVGRYGAEMAVIHYIDSDERMLPVGIDPAGGSLRAGVAGIVTLVPLDTAMTPEAADGALVPPLMDAIPDPIRGRASEIAAPSRTFTASLDAPAGTVALTRSGEAAQLHVLGGAVPAEAAPEGNGPPFELTITAAVRPPGSPHYEASLYLVTPAGHGYRASFSVRVVSGAPALSVQGGFFNLGLEATVSGRTAPDARVVVDGTETSVGVDGSFRALVPAGVTPREVTVVATDPFGHTATKQVSVLAPLDYRRLPWIPITAVLTMVAAVVLFLRAPRPTAHRGETSVDEGTFEDVDPD